MSDGISAKDQKYANLCLNCKLCNHARKKQGGPVFWIVKHVEGSICPACKAYERVHGRKAHEPLPEA